ncbi:permease of the major facilitator superfamily [Macrophomina phaseolina]|uniref:Permease of the major facilitator superfamily n=1 Tax=Macrophomina phaseolina TaxID=35725 RepID=A0ABQ8G9U0_9PEZI|nr:permease of the major facilitator superfamily [Macrophomina phaseolina]
MSAQDEEFLVNFPEEKRKRAIRKWRLVPVLLLLYLITYIDKTNIGNAKIEGLLPSLGMDGTQYNVALSIFFIPYVLAEVPSNMILERFTRPSLYLGSIVLAWGVIMTCTGIVQNFAGLTVIRFLLGLFEAGFFPGAILLISKWYLPGETQTRIALLYSSAASGGAFSGLLAFGLAKMDGLGGLEGWRWIFIMEGIVTVIMAVLCFFFLVDSPALSSRWLDPDEIRYLELRQYARHMQDSDQSAKEKTVHWDALWAVMTDWKIYLLILVNWSNAVPNYALKFTMPQIIKNMGYTSATAQLLTMPPYAVGALTAYAFSVFADRYSWRMPFIVGPQLSLVVAFSILFTKSEDIKDNIALCYFAVCLACFGMYPILPGVNAWNVANLAGPQKRSIGIGWLICAGNIGGVIGSYIYVEDEAPRYPTGYGTSFAFASAGILACLVLEFALWTINKRNARFTEEQIRAQYTSEQLHKMGDKSPLYKYSL